MTGLRSKSSPPRSPRREDVRSAKGPAACHKLGFSLVELTVVVAIMAVISTLVLLSVRGHVQQARLESALDRIETLDARLRASARRTGRLTILEVDSRPGVLRDRLVEAPSRQVTLGRGIRIDRMRNGLAEMQQGRVTIGISEQGQSNSYALRLRADAGPPVWLVVLGLSGQCLRLDDDQEVNAILGLHDAG